MRPTPRTAASLNRMESERRRRVSHAMRRTIRRGGGGPDHGRLDWLGSERLAAWTNQTLASGEAYAPFGEGYAGAGAGGQMFTGKGQRLAAGIYDFPFRHYSPAQEFPREIPPAWPRWLSPDPSGLAAVDPANPQSWNAYAYVANQPLTATDPLGLNGNGSTGCGVGQPVDGVCPAIFTVNVWGNLPIPGPTFAVTVYAGLSPPGLVNADTTGVPYCAANPAACMIWGLSQHPNGPGGGGGGGTGGNGVAAAAMASPQGPSCSQFQKAAGALAARFETLSKGLGWTADGAGLAAFVSFLGEAPSLGADSPLTLGLAATTETLYQASTYTGAAGAALGGFAAGNVASICAFDWSHLVGMATEAATLDIPGLSNLAETIGGMAEQASGLALAAQEVRQ